MICHMLFYVVTHTDILFILLLFLLLEWIRHRKTVTITTKKTATPTVIAIIIPVEFDPSDLLANHKGCQHKYYHPIHVSLTSKVLIFSTVNKLHKQLRT